MVASNGEVYNIVDLLTQLTSVGNASTASIVPTSNGSNVQAMLDTIGTDLDNLENDIADLNQIESHIDVYERI